MKKLYFGDCLDVLKQLHQERSEGFVDLIYIDPPFNSKRDYNVLFESLNLSDSTAQKQAFADTWSNVSYMDTLNEIQSLDLDLFSFLTNLDNIRIPKGAIAYLTTMAIRIHYMHKVLKPTGSFYLHCDPTMSHYLKLLCDLVFGADQFRDEIIWKRSPFAGSSKSRAQQLPHNHDVILFYTVGTNWIWNAPTVPYTEKYLTRFKWKDERGYYRKTLLKTYSKETLAELKEGDRLINPATPGAKYSYKQYLNESSGFTQVDDVWGDINMINPVAKERLGYPTQKPEGLLERIIKASSKEGDIVADFFCGCGTTIAVAEHQNRNWIGVDISHLAIRLIAKRLRDHYRGNKAKLKELTETVEVHGLPKDIASAKELAQNVAEGRFGFQDWVIEVMLGGVSNEKKVADGGYDGYLTFNKSEKQKEVVLIEVKSGNVNVTNVREFIHVVQKQKAKIGVFVCFKEQVTQPMLHEAKKEGYYDHDVWGDKFDQIQIITVEDLLNGDGVNVPTSSVSTFKTAAKKETEGDEQLDLSEQK